MEKLNYKFDQLKSASTRLDEALVFETSDQSIKADSVIQRFEFTTELFWKFLKALLEFKGQEVSSTPVDVVRAAKSSGILEADDEWIKLIRDRNLTSHIYDEAQAAAIYARIEGTYAAMFKEFVEAYEDSTH